MVTNHRHAKTTKLWLAVITLVLLMIIALAMGRYQISIGELSTILLHPNSANPVVANIVYQLRLPRVLGTAIIGAALAISGTAYQNIFQNPLVSPDLLGVSNGAAVGAATAILLGFHTVGIQIMAFLIGLLAVTISIAIPRAMQRFTTLSLVLAGIVVSGLMQAILGLLKYLADPESQLQNIVYWQLGNLSKVTLDNLIAVLPMLLLGGALLWIMRWRLTVLSLGDKQAQAQGINVSVERKIVIVSATILTAGAVCLSGTIGWIGLIVPHMARLLIGPNTRYALPLSGLLGASFLLIVDTLARTISAGEIPLSILTGFIGTPIFIYILLTRKVSL